MDESTTDLTPELSESELQEVETELEDELRSLGSSDWLKKLDELGEERKQISSSDAAAYRDWSLRVFQLLAENYLFRVSPDEPISDRYERRQDAIVQFMENLRKYDPHAARATTLSRFALRGIKLNEYTSWRKDHNRTDRERPLEPKSDDDKGASLNTEDPAAPDPYSDVIAGEYLMHMTAMLLNFLDCPGSAGNSYEQDRIPLYRLWFSELAERFVKRGVPVTNEADLSRALEYGYLDFYLIEPNRPHTDRTLRWLRGTVLREYFLFRGERLPIREHSDGWLYADVPRAYLEQTSGTAPTTERIGKTRSRFLLLLQDLFREKEIL